MVVFQCCSLFILLVFKHINLSYSFDINVNLLNMLGKTALIVI